MRRTRFTLFAALLLAIGMLPSGVATAVQDAAGDALSGKHVVESSTGSYIVVMDDDPLVADFGQDGLDSSRARARSRGLQKGHDKTLRDAGVDVDDKVQSFTTALNGFSAVMSFDEAQRVAGAAGVKMVIPDEMRHLDTDASPAFLGLSDPAGPWDTGVTGEGVVVGVIDSGIWPEHPSFADDGSYDDPGLDLEDTADNPACNFGNTAHNPTDAAFECNNKLVGARQMLATYRALVGAEDFEFDSARDDDGHGTHVASTAAGNAGVEASMYGIPQGTISGVAPRAHVIAYKGLGTLGGFTSDLVSAIDQAVIDGVDVINYSVGGGPSLTGGDDIAYLFAADAGVFVATSAGNSGPGPATIGGPASVPWLTTVGASTQSRFLQGTATLGDGSQYSGASVTPGVGSATLVDAEDVGGDLCIPGTLDPDEVEGNIVLCRRGAIARAGKSLAVFQAGGAGMILYNNSDTDNLFTDTHWVPSIHIDNTPGLAIKGYIDAAGSDAAAEIVTGEVSTWASAPSMTIFSSRGPDPVAQDIIKPDVTAPGMQILAGNTPVPGPGSVPGELFQAIAGTSMSSPHVAGLFALLKQVHPDWTPAMAKSALMTTSYQDVVDNDRVTPATPFSMGAGHVDPGSAVRMGSSFQPGLVYDAGFNDYLGFLCDADPSVFANPDATCAALQSVGIPTDASDLNLPSIGIADLAGTQTVTRTVTSVAEEQGWRTYDVAVDAPDGFDVTVSPSRIRLKQGRSATYSVTITNVSAPVGTWRHGSLEWRDTTGHYTVHSPVSVRAALFDAPTALEGSGEDGSVSFDVSFGYTGDYAAGAHGLVPATVTSDNVVQDPDQTFDPTDGFSNLHEFDLSGAAMFRIAMPPDAVPTSSVDLDIFVYDPDGNQVASSTNGGTNELVDIVLPADGTWSVYVHGWQTAGPDVDYDMYAWAVPLAAGTGNLEIAGAPSSAVLGATGTVDATWTGASAGQWHLGAVSHSGDVGLMGLTLVEVDNR